MADINGIPVENRWIELSEDTPMVSLYEGRGIPAKSKTFARGTKAFYRTFPYNGKYAAWSINHITHWLHIVEIHEGRTTYQASCIKPVSN